MQKCLDSLREKPAVVCVEIQFGFKPAFAVFLATFTLTSMPFYCSRCYEKEGYSHMSSTSCRLVTGTVKPQAEAVATSDKDNKTAAVESSANQSPAHVSSQTGAESNIKVG